MMRYYEENLFHRISLYKKTRINSLEVKIILYQIFKGLSYLHSLGVCHRDIKPENILLKGCAAVICDFGSAKVMGVNESNISYICARCYRAPELIFGATKYSTVIDVWSAGCVIL
jgi:glycogen synthase kinase 3 beta